MAIGPTNFFAYTHEVIEQQIYDEAEGPFLGRTRRPVPCEWDDPTFEAACAHLEYSQRLETLHEPVRPRNIKSPHQ